MDSPCKKPRVAEARRVNLLVRRVRGMRDHIPSHLKAKAFFPAVDEAGEVHVVCGVSTDDDDEIACPHAQQFATVEYLGLVEWTAFVVEIVRGRLPAACAWYDVAAEDQKYVVRKTPESSERLFWFTKMASTGKHIAVDVTHWCVLPTLQLTDVPCVRRMQSSMALKLALEQLMEEIEASKTQLSSRTYDELCRRTAAVFARAEDSLSCAAE